MLPTWPPSSCGSAVCSLCGWRPRVGSPNLKPETSTNYELAAYYEGQRWGFNVTGFINKFEDQVVGKFILTKETIEYKVDRSQEYRLHQDFYDITIDFNDITSYECL